MSDSDFIRYRYVFVFLLQYEQVHMLDDYRGRLRYRLLRGDAPVRPYLHNQPVIVSLPADPRLFYPEIHFPKRGEGRVHSDHTDGQVFLVQFRGDIPLAFPDIDLSVKITALIQCRNRRLGIQDFDCRINLEIRTGHMPRPFNIEGTDLIAFSVELKSELLKIKDYVDNVFFNSVDRRKLVKSAGNLHSCDRSAF